MCIAVSQVFYNKQMNKYVELLFLLKQKKCRVKESKQRKDSGV